MKSLILVDEQTYVSSVSLLEDGKLKEYYVEYSGSSNVTGSIFKGKVINILNGLQTAFVDYGRKRNGFLSVQETLDHRSVLDQSGMYPQAIEAKEGDFVMVQATKEEIGQKGARLTTNITIPGRYVVFLPTMDFVGVSNKITDPEIREKLIAMLTKVKPKGGGFIARTICLESKKSDILAEIKQLKLLWAKIQNDYNKADDICQIYSDGDLVFRMVRDMFNSDVEAIYCNDKNKTEFLKERLKLTNPKAYEKVVFFNKPGDMYKYYGVLHEVDKLLERKVQLDCGVNLVFDYTEALTVIDVNSAKYDGNECHEETVFKANMVAAVEVARQIRLRNIGGIVIVDFIDMLDPEHKQAVVEALEKEMIFDRTKTRVVGMSPLGIVEITRKKVGKELSTVLLTHCPYCHGDAHTKSADYISRKIMADLNELFLDSRYTGAVVMVNDSMVNEIYESRFLSHACQNEWKDKRIYLVSSGNKKVKNFYIKGVENSLITVPSSARLLF